ncbi:MAG: DUF222 domain-containing protein, partial [Gemmatimonadota bacterium]
REHVRVARALGDLPLTGESMSRGELSFSKVRALTRVAVAANEEDLLELARGCTTAQLERMARAWKKGTRVEEADLERERHDSRTLSVFPDEEGMYLIRGRLDPEVGVVVMRAVEAANDALYRERTPVSTRDSHREAARRRADAIGLMAERALSAGYGSEGDDGDGGDDGSVVVPSSSLISGTRAERYQVMLHVEPDTLAAEGEPGRAELEDGTNVSAETSRRISCDAGVVKVTASPDGTVLDVGRRTRTIPPALRRALEVRDRGCRFPGCGLRFTEAHHVIHWADGGETSLENTVLLCRYHHRLMHEEGWNIEWWKPGRAPFRDPRGSVHYGNGRQRAPAEGRGRLSRLLEANRARGVEPDGWTASARWKREADIPDDIFFGALEAGVWTPENA